MFMSRSKGEEVMVIEWDQNRILVSCSQALHTMRYLDMLKLTPWEEVLGVRFSKERSVQKISLCR